MYCFYLRLGRLLVVQYSGFGSKTSRNQVIMRIIGYTAGGLGVPIYGTLIDLLIWMNPSLGVLLIGAVQPYLDYVVADSHWSAAI
jgi:hypothetical protein